MKLGSIISKSRIIDLQSTDLRSALKELLEVCPVGEEEGSGKELLLEQLLDRESTMTTYLGNGVALPHLRIAMKRPYLMAVGRCPAGLEHEGHKEYEEVRQIYLLLANENARGYLNVLASLARTFQDPKTIIQLDGPMPLKQYQEAIKLAFTGEPGVSETKQNKFNRLILKEAETVARGAKCSSILIFGDTFAGGVEMSQEFKGFKAVLVTPGSSENAKQRKHIDAILPVRSFSNNRLSQLRSAVLIGLTRGVFEFNSRLCCVGGIPQSNQFDTIVVVDVEREFRTVMGLDTKMLPASVKPEVVERVLAIATELSVEGREGKPIGCLFVLGDSDNVKKYSKPLVLNPFYGYREEDRNILNPFMDETVKELSLIDGAFIIRGDGVLEAAGTLMHAPDYNHALPGGLGSRHAAAAAITMATECLAVVVSSSTGQVTLFRRGEMLPLMEKALGQGR